ncbi:UDP-N-acetylmuramoyl-tripeptide--D-alanyl-D-alanine ligase [Lentibacillus sp. N15]|uniref:UDP-N-acetylmuramoyl-tripeptide--D-alanyl-D- alanine ligase n=1 Tax=Lentibacillus songyuanensis TaxID=3136161 RepID=UPI0031BB3AFB
MIFTTEWLSTLFTNSNEELITPISINSVITDSRQAMDNALFVPLIGETFDGHNYVKQAFENGAVAAIWDKQYEAPSFLPTDFPIFVVEDTLAALQTLAAAYREKVNPTVIAITGSNGKTTTKDIVAAVMKSTFRTHYTKGNFNNHIGVPLTILSMPPETQMLVLEMGMNHFGEIELLSKLAKPDYAIITNIGESHIEYLGSRAGIAKAKLEITQGLNKDGYLIIDGDEALLESWHNQRHVMTCGFKDSNMIVINDVNVKHHETSFTLSDGSEYAISLLGKHHAKNAAYAIALGKHLGIGLFAIQQSLRSLSLTSMRFEMVTGKDGVSVINDAYNASPTSMKAAIEVIKQMTGFTNKVLVLGDMFELGSYSKELHQSVAEVIDDSITAVYTFGDYAKEISLKVSRQHDSVTCKHFSDRNALTVALQSYLKRDTLVLFKASRGMEFESFVQKIS